MAGETVEREDIRERFLNSTNVLQDVKESADVVVVGSGSGGAVVGKELAEAGLNVIIIEEGGYFDHQDFNQDVPDMFMKLYRDNGSTLLLGRPPISLPIGKCVGGTAVINSGTCFRTPDWVLKKWEILHGIEGASSEQMRPRFERVERIIHAETLPEEVWGKNALVVKRGADRLGLSFKPLVHCANQCKGCGTCVIGCPDGAKESPNVNYIPMAIKAGARIYSRTMVEEIRTKKGRAVGVAGYLLDENGMDKLHRIEVSAKVVVMAAGALHTPALLLKNRLANSSGQVGRNLFVHPGSRVAAEFEERIEGWVGVPQGTYIDDFEKDGILFEGIAVPPSIGAPILPFVGMEQKEFMTRLANIATYGILLSDSSTGRVKNVGIKPIARYQLNRFDAQRMFRALAILAKIFFAAGAVRVFPTLGNITTIKEEDIPALEKRKPNPKDLEMMAFHPLGTCRMGADPASSVVDSNMECHDVKNLFIADAAVFPSSLGVNPMESIMAFATKLAEYLAGDGRGHF